MPAPAAFPTEAVRDLLGIARALYAARKREFAPVPELDELAQVGKKLTLALKLARSADTDDHREAWSLAEDACQRLGRAVARSLVVLEAGRFWGGPLRREGRA